MSSGEIEVNIVKRITSLPSVFMLKHYSGQVIKVATDDRSFADCSKYISRSGATFDGCYSYDGIFMKETRGIYYTPGVPLVEIHNRRKITRNIGEMKSVIEELIKDLKYGDEKLLIWFDNYKIRIYDKYKKGQLLSFNVYTNHGNLAFYEIPEPRDLPIMRFSEVNQMTVYNHSLKFADKVMLSEPYSSPGTVYILYVDKPTDIDVSSPDHGQSKLTLSGERYYLMVHPYPVNKVD